MENKIAEKKMVRYNLKKLDKDTPLEVIIDVINLLDVTITEDTGNPMYQEFIKKHGEYLKKTEFNVIPR